MKTNDLNRIDLHHLPPCDPERHAPRAADGPIKYTRIVVPVDRPSMRAAAPEVAEDCPSYEEPIFDLDIVRLDILRHRNRSEMRALDVLIDLERARRAVDMNGRIGVVFMVRDPAAFDAINFPGQVEMFIPDGRAKKFEHGNWLVEVLCLDEIGCAARRTDDCDDDDYEEHRFDAVGTTQR